MQDASGPREGLRHLRDQAKPYAEIVRLLLAAGATVPERIGEHGARATALIAELGIDPPA